MKIWKILSEKILSTKQAHPKAYIHRTCLVSPETMNSCPCDKYTLAYAENGMLKEKIQCGIMIIRQQLTRRALIYSDLLTN